MIITKNLAIFGLAGTMMFAGAGVGFAGRKPSPYASFCGVALAAAIVGIGAGALGVLAAVTGGGTAVIAGFVLTGSRIGVLAGIAGSHAAVLGWVSHNIC